MTTYYTSYTHIPCFGHDLHRPTRPGVDCVYTSKGITSVDIDII